MMDTYERRGEFLEPDFDDWAELPPEPPQPARRPGVLLGGDHPDDRDDGIEEEWPATLPETAQGRVVVHSDEEQPRAVGEQKTPDETPVETPPEPPAQAGGGSDRPPVPPRDTPVPGPDDQPERPDSSDDAPNTVVNPSDIPREATLGLEVDGKRVSINNNYEDQALLDQALEWVREDVPEDQRSRENVPPSGERPEFKREYYADDSTNPRFFAKQTVFRNTADAAMQDGHREVRFAPIVRAAVESEEVQEAARETGFGPVKYVEPLVAISTVNPETGEVTQTVVYPWQEGRPGERPEPGRIGPTEEQQRLGLVADRLREALEDRGIRARDLTRDHFMIGGESGNDLFHFDTEYYSDLVPPMTEAVFAPAEVWSLGSDGWERHTASSEAQDDATLVPRAGEGVALVGRRASEGESPVFTGGSQDGRVVTLWNGATGEGALIHLGVDSADTYVGEQRMQEVMMTLPSLASRDTVAYVVGDTQDSRLGIAAGLWNNKLISYLWSRNITTLHVFAAGSRNVSLDLANGRVVVSAADGTPVSDQTPPRSQRPAN
ncbi:MAG TPA: hypothetical protein VLF40_04010 [Candidatus Saccharimonadales bacterium]|nr:hypothetical protein [Candidatus Saccharimonadales bacterium]